MCQKCDSAGERYLLSEREIDVRIAGRDHGIPAALLEILVHFEIDLTIPSAIVPETFNVLLNPADQDAKRIVIRPDSRARDRSSIAQVTRLRRRSVNAI